MIAVYVAVALGATMLVGGSTLVEQKEVVLAAPGDDAAGTVGMLLVSAPAAGRSSTTLRPAERRGQGSQRARDGRERQATAGAAKSMRRSLPVFVVLVAF